jgi:hypothetical protein
LSARGENGKTWPGPLKIAAVISLRLSDLDLRMVSQERAGSVWAFSSLHVAKLGHGHSHPFPNFFRCKYTPFSFLPLAGRKSCATLGLGQRTSPQKPRNVTKSAEI